MKEIMKSLAQLIELCAKTAATSTSLIGVYQPVSPRKTVSDK